MVLTVDCETTTHNNGHPFDPRNVLCAVGIKELGKQSEIYRIEHGDEPYGDELRRVNERLAGATILVFFHGKFDLHWLRRYGVYGPEFKGRIYDCQSGAFILGGQTPRYPSLLECCASREIRAKQSPIPGYWDQGIDTRDIPWGELAEYLEGDLVATEALYLKLLDECKDNLKRQRLISLVNQDTLVLQEMEWNGMLYDVEESRRLGDECRARIDDIRHGLVGLVTSGSTLEINWNSPEHVSAVLYGGDVREQYKEEFLFTYKDPKKEPVVKTRWAERVHSLPRLVEPLKGTKLKKENLFSTSEDVLRKLKPKSKKARQIIEGVIEINKLDKLAGSYYEGIPKLIETKGWKDNILHGNLNQCVAVTGRLSSSDPNQQNQPEAVKKLIRSRFAENRMVS
jgi:DNA polymerase I-like protein with 3'-5' exonuclease and polymerase domains